MDGVWAGPVHDVVEKYDTNADGKPDVTFFTREQDSGAWSYDGTTGRKIAVRELALLNANGNVTDRFEEMTAYRKNGRLVTSGEMRGEEEPTDLIGSISHTDYLSTGRAVRYERAFAKEDSSGKLTVDADTLHADLWNFP